MLEIAIPYRDHQTSFEWSHTPEAPIASAAATFVRELASVRFPQTSNPWAEAQADDVNPESGWQQRQSRLAQHLSRPPRLLLVGEAPGYQGARVSGAAFTSEALLLQGVVPGLRVDARLSTRHIPWSEPSAKIVWKALHGVGLAESTILWNAFPIHPYGKTRLSNRTPSAREMRAGLYMLEALMQTVRDVAGSSAVQVAAVGAKAAAALHHLGVTATPLRHPAYGGATIFRDQIRVLSGACGDLAEPTI